MARVKFKTRVTPVEGAALWRVRAGDLQVGQWVQLAPDPPLEDANFEYGVVTNNAEGAVAIFCGPYLGRQEYRADDEITLKWLEGEHETTDTR